MLAIQPKGDKVARVARISPMIEAGKVALPHHAAWLADFEREISAFPNVPHDDQVDALSQYLNWLREREKQGQMQIRKMQNFQRLMADNSTASSIRLCLHSDAL